MASLLRHTGLTSTRAYVSAGPDYTEPPMPVHPPRAFLSYARRDGLAFATALRDRLAEEEREITVWQDLTDLEGGIGWWRQIEAALDQVKFLIVVMTPGAIVSEIARREWRAARQRGVIVYPVKGVPD